MRRIGRLTLVNEAIWGQNYIGKKLKVRQN